jgi:hypothetical protein
MLICEGFSVEASLPFFEYEKPFIENEERAGGAFSYFCLPPKTLDNFLKFLYPMARSTDAFNAMWGNPQEALGSKVRYRVGVAQWIERLPAEEKVGGSTPLANAL